MHHAAQTAGTGDAHSTAAADYPAMPVERAAANRGSWPHDSSASSHQQHPAESRAAPPGPALALSRTGSSAVPRVPPGSGRQAVVRTLALTANTATATTPAVTVIAAADNGQPRLQSMARSDTLAVLVQVCLTAAPVQPQDGSARSPGPCRNGSRTALSSAHSGSYWAMRAPPPQARPDVRKRKPRTLCVAHALICLTSVAWP